MTRTGGLQPYPGLSMNGTDGRNQEEIPRNEIAADTEAVALEIGAIDEELAESQFEV